LTCLLFGGVSIFGMFLGGGSGAPRKHPLLMVLLSAVLLMGVGCGGTAASQSNPPPPPPAATATPSGTYNVTVTASSGSVQHSAVAQIVVQ
jgi:hypothetical protein